MAGPITFQTMPALTNTSSTDVPAHLGQITGTAQRSNANLAAINAWASKRLRTITCYHESGNAVAVPDAHWTVQSLEGYRLPLTGNVSLCTIFGRLLYVSPTAGGSGAGSGDLPTDIPLYTPTAPYQKTIADGTWADYFPVTLLDSGSPFLCVGGIATDIAGGASYLIKLSMPSVVISNNPGTGLWFTHTYVTGASA